MVTIPIRGGCLLCNFRLKRQGAALVGLTVKWPHFHACLYGRI